MKYSRKYYILVLGTALLCMAFAKQDAGKNIQSFTALKQLEGTWQMQGSKGILYENWIIAGDKKMLGKTYRLNNADTVFYEHVRLLLDNDRVFYIPTTGQNDERPVRFELSAAENNHFTFENPAHDFPKRIVYHFVSADSIHAFIDDGNAGGKRIDYYYGRVK